MHEKAMSLDDSQVASRSYGFLASMRDGRAFSISFLKCQLWMWACCQGFGWVDEWLKCDVMLACLLALFRGHGFSLRADNQQSLMCKLSWNVPLCSSWIRNFRLFVRNNILLELLLVRSWKVMTASVTFICVISSVKVRSQINAIISNQTAS